MDEPLEAILIQTTPPQKALILAPGFSNLDPMPDDNVVCHILSEECSIPQIRAESSVS